MTFPDPSDDFRRRLTKPRQRRTLAGLPSDIDGSEQPVPAIGPSLQGGPRLRIRALHRGANHGVDSRASLLSDGVGRSPDRAPGPPGVRKRQFGARGNTQGCARHIPRLGLATAGPERPGPGDPLPKAVVGRLQTFRLIALTLSTASMIGQKIGQKIGQTGKAEPSVASNALHYRHCRDMDGGSLRAERSAKMPEVPESPTRIEPARLETLPARIADLVADLAARSAELGVGLHPKTARHLADLVRIMNTYYSNLIEGHNTRPRDIERALAGVSDADKRDLQAEAVAHYRVQQEIDRLAADHMLPDPADPAFLQRLHRDFYADASEAMLTIKGARHTFLMTPGEWRRGADQDVEVGDHLPPASEQVPAFMAHFHRRFAFQPAPGEGLISVGPGRSSRIVAMATAHHRFAWIHPFPDGNGRVGRLMSHAMAHEAGIGAHGLWSISRGLARGLDPGPEGRTEYKRHMARADEVRRGDRDGRGHLSLTQLESFTAWFLEVCLEQVRYMGELFELNGLSDRLTKYVLISGLPAEANALLQETLIRGELDRGEAERVTRLPERSARRILKELTERQLLVSDTPKGPVSLRFPADTLDVLFPRLYA